MKCYATKTFLHDQLGRVEKGSIIDVTDAQFASVKPFGFLDVVEEYDTKVIEEKPRKKKVK